MDGFNSAKYDSTNDPYGNERYKAIENEAEAEIARLEDDYKARLRDLEKWKRKERDILNRRTKSRKRELDEALEAERERSKARQQQSQEEQAATCPGRSFPESVHGDDKNILISPTRQRSLSPPPLPSKRAKYRPPPRRIIEHSPAEVLASIEEIPIYNKALEANIEQSKARQQQNQKEQAATRPGRSFPESVHGNNKNIPIPPARQRSLSPPPLSSKRARYRPPPRHVIEHSPAEVLASIEEIPIYKQLIRNYFIYVPGTSVPVKLHHFLNFKDQMKRFYPENVRADDNGWFIYFGYGGNAEGVARACFEYLDGRKFMGKDFKMKLVGLGLMELASTLPPPSVDQE